MREIFNYFFVIIRAQAPPFSRRRRDVASRLLTARFIRTPGAGDEVD
jgi:hypothetical protein